MLLPSFRHKVLLCWINDISTVARTGKRWPIIDVDDQTLQDYQALFSVMKTWGFDTIAIWGLFISHSWQPDIAQSISEERRGTIARLLDAAHAHGIRVLAGLGLYSWGFEAIIREHPEVAKNEGRFVWGEFKTDNAVAMCYSTEVSKEWQRKIIDFMGEFDIDGFQMQSADQGRCACSECRRMGDMEYHAAVNDEFATYIRAKWPAMTIAVSGWGMSFREEQSIPHFQRMSRALDYITDVTDQPIATTQPIRKRIIEAISCSFGSLGGMVVVPPQRWDRLRWFLPHARITGKYITALAADGGSAFEFFAGPLANPQYEIMTKFVGYMLNHPSTTVEAALALVVEDTLSPHSSSVRDGLVHLLLEAESNYFSKIEPVSGEFDFEPLMGEEAGPPIYLKRLSLDGLQGYHKDVQRWRDAFIRISQETQKTELSTKIVTCTDNMLQDIARSLS